MVLVFQGSNRKDHISVYYVIMIINSNIDSIMRIAVNLIPIN